MFGFGLVQLQHSNCTGNNLVSSGTIATVYGGAVFALQGLTLSDCNLISNSASLSNVHNTGTVVISIPGFVLTFLCCNMRLCLYILLCFVCVVC